MKLHLAVTLLISLLASNPVSSQIVIVESGSETGHGFLVQHGRVCYLVTPRHVTGTRRVATVKTAAPMRSATAVIELPFWNGMDLAIGTVRAEGLGDYCRFSLAQFDQTVEAESGQRMHLTRIRSTGEIERLPMEFRDTSYLTFDTILTRAQDSFFRGTSGAFAMSGDRPVGMIIESPDGRIGRFIRIEEIHQNVARWIQRSIRLPSAPVTQPSRVIEGMRVALHSVTQPPLNSESVPENMLGEGAYVFPAGRNQIIFRIPGVQPVGLSRLDIRSDPDADYALPKQIIVDINTAADPTSGWRRFSDAEMAPDGTYSIHRSQQLARWVRLTVETAQEFGAVGIASVALQ